MKQTIPLHLRPPAPPPKPYSIPALRPARFRVPVADCIDPMHATPIVCDTGKQRIELATGHRIPLASMARSRHTRRLLKRLAENFGA